MMRPVSFITGTGSSSWMPTRLPPSPATITTVRALYKPMAPSRVREPFHRAGWIFEEKVDGWRLLAYKDGSHVRLVSRNGVDHTSRFAGIAAAIAKLSARTLVLDGEVAIYDDRFRSRFKWLRPGELLHLDVKKLGRIGHVGHRITGDRRGQARGIGWEFVHVCVDDCSRVSYAEVLGDEKGPAVAAFLRRAVALFRRRGVRAQRVLTDNGAGYRSRVFAAVCRARRLAHRRTRPHTPRTNGKAERFIRTLLREWAYGRAFPTSAQRTAALGRWLHYYNWHRRHRGVGGPPPISRLVPA